MCFQFSSKHCQWWIRRNVIWKTDDRRLWHWYHDMMNGVRTHALVQQSALLMWSRAKNITSQGVNPPSVYGDSPAQWPCTLPSIARSIVILLMQWCTHDHCIIIPCCHLCCHSCINSPHTFIAGVAVIYPEVARHVGMYAAKEKEWDRLTSHPHRTCSHRSSVLSC